MSRTKKAARRRQEKEEVAAKEEEKQEKKEEEAGDQDNDSDDGSSDSDDSGDDVDVDAETAQQLMALEQDLQTNPSYDKHLQYISLLRATPGLRTRLRDAHEALSASFPLTEELWLAWVNDELAGVSGPEDVEWLLGLLRRAATRDYLAPGVWELYLEVAHDLDTAVRDLEPEGVDRYRALCEEAVAAAGLHLAAGHKLWEKYRKFELEVEAKLTAGGKAGSAVTKQQDRIRALYQRQLQVPLLDVAETLEEYKAWEAGLGKSVPPHVIKAAEKAREAAEVRAGCEAGVAAEAPADVAKLGAFLSYIKMEQKAGDSARVQVLYERAVAAFPLTHSLWLQYGQYMETHTKLPGPINGVYSRAVRNCPWVGAVWERAIRALDLTGMPGEEVEEVYERALGAGLQSPEDLLAIILARLDYLRRRASAAAEAVAAAAATAAGGAGAALKKAAAGAFAALREAFRTGGELMTSRFPEHVDRALRLPAYWANCEVHVMGDVAAAREVWESALKGAIGRYAEAWEAYIAMEREQRALMEARAIYKRCHSRRFEEDGQLRICHAWLRFEREEGSADGYLQALLKVEPIIEESAAAAAAAADQVAAAAAKEAVQKAKNLSKEEVKAMRQSKDPNFKKEKKDKKDKKDKKGAKLSKRPRQEGEEQDEPAADAAGQDAAPLTASKRVRIQEPGSAAEPAAGGAEADPAGHADADMADQEDATAADAEAAGGGGSGGGAEEEEDHEAGPGPGDKAAPGSRPRPHYTDKLTVFIRGFKPEVKDPEVDAFLRQQAPEGIKEIRLPRDLNTGQARGIAYVECASRDVLDEVVKLNGTSFQGAQLFVAESRPPSHNYGHGYGYGYGGRGPGGRFPGRGGRFSGPPGARGGGFAGRGRFGGGGRGRGSDGGTDGDGDTDMADAGGGGGAGGRGGGRGGRGHPGLGHPSGRGHFRTHIMMEPGAGAAGPTALVPRSVQMARGGGAGAADDGQPKSNEDFRKLLLGGKK